MRRAIASPMRKARRRKRAKPPAMRPPVRPLGARVFVPSKLPATPASLFGSGVREGSEGSGLALARGKGMVDWEGVGEMDGIKDWVGTGVGVWASGGPPGASEGAPGTSGMGTGSGELFCWRFVRVFGAGIETATGRRSRKRRGKTGSMKDGGGMARSPLAGGFPATRLCGKIGRSDVGCFALRRKADEEVKVCLKCLVQEREGVRPR